MKIAAFAHLTRNAGRFIEITSVLVKYGLATWVEESDPGFLKGLLKSSEGIPIPNLPPEVRVRKAFAELGTTFIKLGQVLSTRVDLVGPVLAKELGKLLADTPPDPPEVVRRTLESELGKPVEAIFELFDFQPIASASIGQVHRARLHDGRGVVVKVQRAGIEEKAATDLEILEYLAELTERYDPAARPYQPRIIVAEFNRSLLRELDYRRELRHLEQFGRNFHGDATICIPAGYAEFTTRHVLTMAEIDGISLTDTERLRAEGVDLQDLARRGADIYLNMVFRDGFFHADPHPGNLQVLPDGKIGLLDCGMVGRLDEEMHQELEGMLMAFLENDPGLVTQHLLRMVSIPPGFDRNTLRRDVDDFLGDYIGLSLQDLDLSDTLESVSEILRRHHLTLPVGTTMLIRMLVLLEGTSRLLDRDFSLAELLRPHYRKVMERRFSPERLMGRVRKSYRDWSHLMDMMPRELAEILLHMRAGKFEIHIEHHRLDSVVNRLVYGLLASALFLGSCLILSRRIPPLLGDISIAGAMGCVLAFLIGIRLLKAIRRSGDLRPRDGHRHDGD